MSIVFFALTIIWIVFALTAYPLSGNVLIDLFGIIGPEFIFMPSAIMFLIFKNKFCIDYDYTFISGTVKVAKVVKNLKRKFLFKFDVSAIEKLGKYGSDTYEKYQALPGISKIVLTSNAVPSDGKDFYYLVVTICAEKKLLIFECTETFMVNILKFSNKAIVEEDYE